MTVDYGESCCILNAVNQNNAVNNAVKEGMGSKQRREREKESLRQDILDAARELFVIEGYENVSMRRIAEKIEYSPTTIYLYFKDKAELLYSLCEETFTQLAEKMFAIAAEGGDPVEVLRKGCLAYVEFGLNNPNHYRVAFMMPNQLGRDHYLKEGSAGLKAYAHLRSAIEECVQKGRFKDGNVEALTQTVWAAVHGITSLLIYKPDFPWVGKDELKQLMIRVLINGLSA